MKIKTANQAIRICVDCGSTLIFIDEAKIRCKECGAIRKIFEQKILTFDTN